MTRYNDRLQRKYPYFSQVPTDLVENLRWRAHVRTRCLEDEDFRETIKQACEEDPLFYWTTFCWTFDPLRYATNPERPFIPYPFQVEALDVLLDAVGNYDILIKKARDMGASWMMLMVFEWRWHFMPMQSFLMGSRKEELVDRTGDPKTLFWKIDYIHKNLPWWLKPNLNRYHLHLENYDNGSTIEGEATGPNFATGDRKTAVLLDEFAKVACGRDVLASTQAVTKCRFFNSTPYGIANAHYDMGQTDVRKLILPWYEHPEKRPGLYTSERGRLEIRDETYKFPENYKFILDGKLRSPWYDVEESRMPYPRLFAQEVEMDERGSGGMFFNGDAVHKCIERNAISPYQVGHLHHDADDATPGMFKDDPNGPLRLWVHLEDGEPPHANYVIGCDVAQGTGASNSTMCVWNVQKQTKVAEFCSPHIRPEAFTCLLVAMAKWFCSAKVIWEDRGPGKTVTEKLVELGYFNFFFRPASEDSVTYRQSDKPGWSPSKDGKAKVLMSYRDALEADPSAIGPDDVYCCNPSKRAMLECLDYVWDEKGGVKHAKSGNSEDPSGARENHGDLVIGDALAWMLVKEGIVTRRKQQEDIPANCIAARRKARQKAIDQEAELIWEA